MHERQHMAQITKTLRAINCYPGEAALLLAEAEIARGNLEALLLGLPDDVVRAEPGHGLPSISSLLADATKTEATKATAISAALS
jgi:hypothetical protein